MPAAVKSIFCACSAWVGRIDSETRCRCWSTHPAEINFDPALLTPVDLSRTPQCAREGRIDWDEIQVDDLGEKNDENGVTTIGPRSVTSTDHLSFDNAGIPAFQFMVDRLEYNSRTHHSTMDTFDRVQRDDMVQQATVIAVFAYNEAMRDEKIPRKALPTPRR